MQDLAWRSVITMLSLEAVESGLNVMTMPYLWWKTMNFKFTSDHRLYMTRTRGLISGLVLTCFCMRRLLMSSDFIII